MELQQIRYFLAVVDAGTFMAAAEQVHVTQPTLSAGIRKLEGSLNVQLFNRGSRAATLTPAGELLLSHARPAYNQLTSIKARLSGEQERISLGILNSIPMDHVSDIIKKYRLSSPHVYIEVVVENNDKLLDMLQRKKLDMIITTNQASLENFTRMFDEKLMVVLSSQHPYAKSSGIYLKQLDEQPFIERLTCESWESVHHAFQENNINPRKVCQAESDETVLSLVSAGLGLSIMPFRNTPYKVRFVGIKDLQIVRHIVVAVSSPMPAQPVQDLYDTATQLFARKKLIMAEKCQ